MMKSLSASLTLFAALLIIGSPAVFAQPTHIEYDFSGSGNFMVSPIHYTGSIDAGEPLLVGGYWNLWIDDTGWPPDTDKLVRWLYIDSVYFAPFYDDVYDTWTGVFDENTTASSPVWNAGSGAGELQGTATLQISISDFNADQIIDPDERGFTTFSGTLIVIKNGSGVWAGYCGLGSFSGWAMNPDPINWADDTVQGHTILDVEDCSVPVEEITWGQVKQLYQN